MRNTLRLSSALSVLLLSGGLALAEGAIAVNDTAGSKPGDAGYGVGYGDTRAGAQEAAMNKCIAAGNDTCKVVVWFKKCGAYVSSNEKYGIGYGETSEVAKTAAMDQCGNDSCRLVAAGCTDE